MRAILLICAVILAHTGFATQLNQELQDALIQRAQLYCDLSKYKYDGVGNIEQPGKCDGALFTSLHGSLCDYISINQFEDTELQGNLCRDPECRCFYEDYGSKSGFSKDMASGVQFFLALHDNHQLIQRIISYGEAHNWVVCDANTRRDQLSHCLMSPKIIGRWYELSQPGRPRLPSVWIPMSKGYGAHLQIVSILIDSLLYGETSSSQNNLVKRQFQRVPQNSLFHAAYARFNDQSEQQRAATALLDRFPEDRLPNSSDWCAEYLFQRDPGSDWLPCERQHTHAGTDFILAAWLLTHQNHITTKNILF
jgi:hypothetical protein